MNEKTKAVRCRFCAYCQIDGYTGSPTCEKYNKTMTENQAKRFRNCENFILINCDKECMDFFLEIEYTERKSHPKAKGQMKLF